MPVTLLNVRNLSVIGPFAYFLFSESAAVSGARKPKTRKRPLIPPSNQSSGDEEDLVMDENGGELYVITYFCIASFVPRV